MSRVALKTAHTPQAHRQLAALARAIWHEHYPGIISVEQIDYMLNRGYSAKALAAEQGAGTRFVLAAYHEAPAGFAATTPDGPDAWLDKLYVEDKARGSGVGRALTDDAIAFARRLGCKRLRLRVNRDNVTAITAYERMGFVVDTTDRKAIGGGFVMDDYLMSQAL